MSTQVLKSSDENPTDDNGVPPAFPPYPPYATKPAPPSLADTIVAGRDLRLLHKSMPKNPVRPLPKPAKPKGPAAGEMKLSRRRLRAHAQCLRKHNIVLSDRLEYMAKPLRRTIMYLWREHGHHLPPETIARMRAMLDADEPFKPAQAYEYFINQRKANRRQKELKVKSIKKGAQSCCGDKRRAWARNATVLFARGIQNRLSRSGSIVLTNGMLRLSNIILGEICGFTRTRKPSRRSSNPKSRFMMDTSDRVAIWIDDILTEADDRMLMMDLDEDEDVDQSTVGSRSTGLSSVRMSATPAPSAGATPSVSKSKVNKNIKRQLKPGHCGLYGEQFDAFNHLVEAMDNKGNQELLKHEDFTQSYKNGSNTLRKASNLNANEFDSKLAEHLNKELQSTAGNTSPATKEIVDKCSKYLADQARKSNIKTKALKTLVESMDEKGDQQLLRVGSYTQTYREGSHALKKATDLSVHKFDPNLVEQLAKDLHTTVGTTSSPGMNELIDESSKYLAEQAVHNKIKTKALKTLVESMDEKGDQQLLKVGSYTQTYREGSHALKNATDLSSHEYDSNLVGQLVKDLHNTVGTTSPVMDEAIDESSKYLAEHAVQNKNKKEALKTLVESMNEKGDQQLLKVGSYTQTYREGSHALKHAKDLSAHRFDPNLVEQLAKDLHTTVGTTSSPGMDDAIDESSKYLAQQAMQNTNADFPRAHSTTFNKSEEFGKNKKLKENGLGSMPKMKSLDSVRFKMEDQGGKSTTGKEPNYSNGLSKEEVKQMEDVSKILHNKLKSQGSKILHQQSPTQLTHTEASNWLHNDQINDDNNMLNSEDVNQLSDSIKDKLNDLVLDSTPQNLRETMHGVVDESSKKLATQFLPENYKKVVNEALISEMQKRGDETLISADGDTESNFFAAQRLKKAPTPLKIKEPNQKVADVLQNKLEDIARRVPINRKLTGFMQEHIQSASRYLSERVLKPDKDIEAYVTLLEGMDARGDDVLLETPVNLTYDNASAYLKQLTSFEDKINKPNNAIQTVIENELKTTVIHLHNENFDKNAMKGAIQNSTKLIVSNVILQGEKTDTLQELLQIMEYDGGDNVLLRHGNISKNYLNALDLLRDKTTVDLNVANADPIVKQKIINKLQDLVDNKPLKNKNIMNDVIAQVGNYLAVHLLQQQISQKICLCRRNVQVQCEMRSNDMLRKRPCCLCSRRPRNIPDQCSEKEVLTQSLIPSQSCGTQISITHCPAFAKKESECTKNSCPAKNPKCTTSYILQVSNITKHAIISANLNTESVKLRKDTIKHNACEHAVREMLIKSIYDNNMDGNNLEQTEVTNNFKPRTVNESINNYAQHRFKKGNVRNHSELKTGGSDIENIYASILSTTHTSELQALFTGIIWNLQIWGHWIQEIIDLAVKRPLKENWCIFKERILSEAFQWRQYNRFIRQLTQNLCERYKSKRPSSPNSAAKHNIQYKTIETIVDTINISFKWSHWISAIIRQTDSLKLNYGLDDLKWSYLTLTIKEYLVEWVKCCLDLKSRMNENFSSIISDCYLKKNEPDPIWIISAYGVVPSGAVEAGLSDDEVIWVARTVHENIIYPAALLPSRHHCVFYLDGKAIFKNKYQVLCNAQTTWMPWRAGEISPRAVTIAPEIYVGRVKYHGSHFIGPVMRPGYKCQVGISGKPIAVQCYELLVS